jgi:F-type H+-transporting ATPase subunit epsilon
MRLLVLLPDRTVVNEEVAKVVAEAENGWFCLLPRHVDFVAALVPGVLVFVTAEGREAFLGTDEGILVKCGDEVRVSTRRAARGEDLGALRTLVAREFLERDERERVARSALARLEAGVVRRFIELEERPA